MQNQLSNEKYERILQNLPIKVPVLPQIHVTGICTFVLCLFVCWDWRVGLPGFPGFPGFLTSRENGHSEHVVGCFRTHLGCVVDSMKIDKKRDT